MQVVASAEYLYLFAVKISQSMPKPLPVTPAILLTACISLMGGGLAGALFTWYVHRPSPALVSYAITTTTTGADSVTKGLIPNLKLKVGDEDIPVLYTHVIELTVNQGDYVDSAEVAITFPSSLRIFGFRAAAPSSVHSIECKQAPLGLVCRLSPLQTGAKYTVNIASDLAWRPSLVTASRNTELIPLESYLSAQSRSIKTRLLSRNGVAGTLAVISYLALMMFLARKMRQIYRRRIKRLGLVGRLIDPSGAAITGARVRIRVEEPLRYACEYDPVVSDAEGDFLFNMGEKVDHLHGTIEVEHKDYAPLETKFTSPILFLTLDAKGPTTGRLTPGS